MLNLRRHCYGQHWRPSSEKCRLMLPSQCFPPFCYDFHWISIISRQVVMNWGESTCRRLNAACMCTNCKWIYDLWVVWYAPSSWGVRVPPRAAFAPSLLVVPAWNHPAGRLGGCARTRTGCAPSQDIFSRDAGQECAPPMARRLNLARS